MWARKKKPVNVDKELRKRRRQERYLTGGLSLTPNDEISCNFIHTLPLSMDLIWDFDVPFSYLTKWVSFACRWKNEWGEGVRERCCAVIRELFHFAIIISLRSEEETLEFSFYRVNFLSIMFGKMCIDLSVNGEKRPPNYKSGCDSKLANCCCYPFYFCPMFGLMFSK